MHDAMGSMSHLARSHAGEELNLYNVYGPNGDNGESKRDLGIRVSQANSRMIILGGDLNTVRLPLEDRQGDSGVAPSGPIRAVLRGRIMAYVSTYKRKQRSPMAGRALC